MRVAVFVDAGYVYPQGSIALSGKEKAKTRDKLTLDENVIAELLKQQARQSSNDRELLRIYWYDAVPSSGPSVEQSRIGMLNDVKLRLGQLNSEGQQKGVDSLIVTDLIELARNRSICDAVVLTGDEDIRIGVQIAQSLGVRVHLLGFVGPKGNQSISLQQEADTLEIWDKSKVASFLRDGSVKAKPAKAEAPIGNTSILVATSHALDLLGKDSKLLSAALKNALAGKDMPGAAVSILKAELVRSLPKKPTKADNKLAREELTRLLRETS
ncbi:MAG: NYN domain-containing protein [Aestuariivirga sp.]